MAHRTFRDSLGRHWEVWTVVPSRVERRVYDHEWNAPDRRRQPEFRVRLGSKWNDGWLAFETSGEKRRLAPIPADWEAVDGSALESLLDQATPVTPSRRLVE